MEIKLIALSLLTFVIGYSLGIRNTIKSINNAKLIEGEEHDGLDMDKDSGIPCGNDFHNSTRRVQERVRRTNRIHSFRMAYHDTSDRSDGFDLP